MGEIRQFCQLQDEGQSLMRAAMSQMNLSARAYHRILKLSRTIADLAGKRGNSIRASGGGAAISSEVNHGIGVMGEIDSKYPIRRFQLQAKS
ncbi:MAG: hypothetical protein U0V48_02420 [Anaerolineales bacterium]